MSSYPFYDPDQPAFPVPPSSDEDFFDESGIIQLEWLLRHGLLDFTELRALLGLPPDKFDESPAYSSVGDQSQSDSAVHSSSTSGGEQKLDEAATADTLCRSRDSTDFTMSRPVITATFGITDTREIKENYTPIERSLATASNSSETLVELKTCESKTSGRSELADDRRDHSPVRDTLPSDAHTRRQCQKKKKRASPSREKWKFKMYVPPTTDANDALQEPPQTTTASTSTPISEGTAASSSSPSLLPLKREREDDLPDPLSLAPFKKPKTEGESLATAASHKRRPRILYKHIPYNPRKYGEPQSKMEFIEWGGPTDESYWGKRVLDGRDDGTMGMKAGQVSESGVLTDGPSGMDGGSY